MRSSATLAANILRFRQGRSLTRAALAEAIGIDAQTLYQYEKGTRWPKAEYLDALAKALKIRPWQLLAGEGEGGDVPTEVVDLAAQLARAVGLKVGGRT